MDRGRHPLDPEAREALGRLEAEFERTIEGLGGLLEGPNPLERFTAAIATLDLLERFREWQREAGPPLVTPTVMGVEATQSIQFFRPAVNIVASGGRTGQQPENDLPLVAGKATVLRVYIENVAGVSGTLEWRAVGATSWAGSLPALNSPFDPPVNPIANRGSSAATLNFRLPSTACVGDLEVRISLDGRARAQESRLIWDLLGRPHILLGISQFWTTSSAFTLRFRVVNPLGIRLVRMRYEGRGLTLPAPSVADFWRTATMLSRMYPLSEITLWAESERLYDGDFSDITPGAQHMPGTINGGTTGDWLHILNNLIVSENAPNCVVYVMLYPPGARGPTNPFRGWGVGRTALVPMDDEPALAHETGHLLWRSHAPCGNPAAPDLGYPNYGTYPRTSIGEFGLDIATMAILNPATVYDFMSYCGPVWISPYTYEGVLDRLQACPGVTGSGGGVAAPNNLSIERNASPREYLALNIQIYRNGRVRMVRPTFHLPAEPGADWGRETEYFVELRDKDGFPLSAKRLWLQDTQVELEDAVTSYLVHIPWHEAATELVVLREDTMLERFLIEPEPPRISELSWYGGEAGGHGTLSWKSDTPGARFAVRYSPDGGSRWFAVAIWLERPSCAIDLDALPGGDAAQMEVVASAGFRTSRVLVPVGSVPRKPRVAEIAWPIKSLLVRRGETVRLLGHVASADGEAPGDAMQWESSRDGPLGTGRELLLHTLSPGHHVITLSADDGLGELTRSARRIEVRD